MTLELNLDERDLLANELERNVIPELRGEIGSGMRKTLREDLKRDETLLKEILLKLKKAA